MCAWLSNEYGTVRCKMIAQKQIIYPKPETDYLTCLLKELGGKKRSEKHTKIGKSRIDYWNVDMLLFGRCPTSIHLILTTVFSFTLCRSVLSLVSVITVPYEKMLPWLQRQQVIQYWSFKASHFPGNRGWFPVIPWPRSG